MEMKTPEFEMPEVTVILFDNEDVITASTGVDPDNSLETGSFMG